MSESSARRAVRAVTFDLDGTLYRARPARLRFVLANVAFLRTIRVARAVRDELRATPFDDGAAFAREEARRVAERTECDIAVARARIDRLFGERLCRALARVGPREDVRDVVRRLVLAGLQVAVVSDYRVPDKLRALGLDDLPWSALVAGEEVGALKPDPRAFVVAADIMGVSPDTVVHIGDRRDTDIVGAERAGMRGLLLDEGHDLASLAEQILSGALDAAGHQST